MHHVMFIFIDTTTLSVVVATTRCRNNNNNNNNNGSLDALNANNNRCMTNDLYRPLAGNYVIHTCCLTTRYIEARAKFADRLGMTPTTPSPEISCATILLALTLPNVGRFSKFFH